MAPVTFFYVDPVDDHTAHNAKHIQKGCPKELQEIFIEYGIQYYRQVLLYAYRFSEQ